MLKRFVALLFLHIHLFNIGGHLAFYQYAEYRCDRFFNQQISKNLYSPDDLTEIKIPVNMPGITDWKYFQPMHGRVQFRDASYNYVKMRMTHNAIYLLCIPNYATTHLSDHNIIYALQIPDIPIPKKEHVPFGKTNLVPCNYVAADYKIAPPLLIVGKILTDNHGYTSEPALTCPGQPPDFSAFLS
jgi:hypothetical protein